jgi:hypothetical protein
MQAQSEGKNGDEMDKLISAGAFPAKPDISYTSEWISKLDILINGSGEENI